MSETGRVRNNELILVTGGAGCIGSRFCLQARELGWPVRALVRTHAETEWLSRQGIDVVTADLTRGVLSPSLLEGVTVAVHCAARVGPGSPGDFRALHVTGLENLLKGFRQSGLPRRFIHLSSLGVHSLRDHHQADETTVPTPRGLGECLQSLVEAEHLLGRFAANHELSTTVLRSGLLYGPRERRLMPELLSRLKNGMFRYQGTGEQLLANTFVGNLADGVIQAIDCSAAVGKTYHITDGTLVTQRDFVSTVARLAGYPVPMAAVPLKWARASAAAQRWLQRLGGGENSDRDPARALDVLGWHGSFSIEKARQELGYMPPVKFAEGMKQTIAWYREQGML